MENYTSFHVGIAPFNINFSISFEILAFNGNVFAIRQILIRGYQ